MKILNEFKMTFKSDSRNENLARVAATAFISQFNPKLNELTEIKTAVSEAVTNSIVHGYRSEEGNVELTIKISEDNIVYIKVRDSGCGIQDIEKAMEPLYTSAPEEERAGLGFAVMESFMDKIKVSSKPDKGTTVTMRRKLNLP